MTRTIGHIIADFETSISSKVSIGDTAMVLVSATDDDGIVLPSGRYLFTVSGNDSSKEYASGDLVSTSVTNIKSVSRQGVETTGFSRQHRANSSIIISNFPDSIFLNNILDGSSDLNSSTPLKYDGAPTINNNAHIATKTQADAMSITDPIADASASVYGINKVSIAPVDAGEPILVGDNDTRVPTADLKAALAGTTGTPGNANTYVTETDPEFTGTMKDTGAESIDGIKTFTSIPVSSAGVPTTDNQLATKGYIDSL